MNDPVISVQHVCRRFGKSQAVDDVSFDVQRGSIFGLLGTNGAGKTTLIRLLMGHLYPDSGELRMLAENPRRHNAETLRRVAYVSDCMQLPAQMCLRDVLRLNERFFPKWNAEFAAQMALYGFVPFGVVTLMLMSSRTEDDLNPAAWTFVSGISGLLISACCLPFAMHSVPIMMLLGVTLPGVSLALAVAMSVISEQHVS